MYEKLHENITKIIFFILLKASPTSINIDIEHFYLFIF